MRVTGWYLNCDDAVCASCFSKLKVIPEPDNEWPLPIFVTDEVDTPTHCVECEDLIEQSYTEYAVNYMRDAIDIYDEKGEGREEIIEQWRGVVYWYD